MARGGFVGVGEEGQCVVVWTEYAWEARARAGEWRDGEERGNLVCVEHGMIVAMAVKRGEQMDGAKVCVRALES